jgi:hypothetical protein
MEAAMKTRRLIPLTILILALVPTASFAETVPSETSESLYTDSWGECRGEFCAAVGSAVARGAKSDDLMPLQIAVGVRDFGGELHLTYKSFVLVDPAGNEIPLANPEEVAKQRKFLSAAQRYAARRGMPVGAIIRRSSRPVLADYYNKDGHFFTGVHLSNSTHFTDVMVFPKPAELDGIFRLRVMTEGMDAPLEIRFKIPHKKK